ncbi:MAG: hypothetical protein JST42_27790 [Bacteroidetes bacterium]|nr:hypothetical protein [Bacteroidota bacterium]
MIIDTFPQLDLKAAILLDSRNFLISVQAGASDEYLSSLLIELRRQEAILIKNEGLMLHPGVWRILVNRFANRKNYEVIDTIG